MLLKLASERKVLFVGGKGGVGKTSVSSALALARARSGGRVLLVSTDPAHNLGHIWDLKLSDTATRVCTAATGYVDAVEIDPQATIERHFKSVGATMMKLLPEQLHRSAQQHLDLAKTAPGSHESAVLERIAELIDLGAADYDLVLFDTAPSGHTLHLLTLPEKLTGWTESLLASRSRSERFAAAARGLVGGEDPQAATDSELRRTLIARRDRFSRMREAITDETATGFVIVSLAEKMPVAESLDIVRQLRDLGIDVASLVVNRRSPADAGSFLAERRELEDASLQVLRRNLPAVPMTELPLLARDLTGEEALEELAALLAGAGGAVD
ncbi:MAG: ArsA family ATPase [Arthrobacter sp.]|uniref:ArsA family ATPase n=1 Tax=unclassified Arthrobacter TaxID=235627 RepID=UPI002652CE13|nr:ArsA family ATPase [Micrococcaceae bacterium]MDN5811886.1 ArsA family ATPase [Micrococcaceae bacterium]MDN5822982.1 ArsA family ATPase [Micrococcaceae bacterium]MDN5878552.1 ArsA family ATPase [Micrococcaceae bacterium]MDN5886393.1 ArsA family ATPase [Micrococcaceae bacterium]